MYVLGPCGSLQRTLLCGWEFLLLSPQPPQVFSVGGLRLYFPSLEPWVARSVSLPSCSSQFICTQMWDCHHLARSASRHIAMSPLTRLPVSTPPTGLDKCFFFNSLVQTSYSLTVCQFWLFFNLLLSFFWLCKEAQCIYLHLHLGRKSPVTFLFKQVANIVV